MSDSFMLRSDYAEMAKAVHSACGAVSTGFLSIRLWTRKTKTQAKGLWWDDYLLIAAWALQLCGNGAAAASPAYGYSVRDGTSQGWTLAFVSLSFFYPAIALGKTAFTATLLRVSGGRTTALLWFIIAVTCAFGIAITVTSWLTPCGRQIDHVIPAACVPADTLIWIHVGNAIATICTDVVLAYVPWRIVNKIYIPRNEKWAVATSMSLVGLSAAVCIVRTVVSGLGMELERQGKDWTYGSVACYALMQAEITIYIAAQTVPLIRVMLQGRSSSTGSVRSSLRRAGGPISAPDKGKSPATGPDNNTQRQARASVELVQLPSGKIVPAGSEEGRGFDESRAGRLTADQLARVHGPMPTTETGEGPTGMPFDDEVHRIWAELGLSRRAWSQSPSPQPERDRGLPNMASTATSS